MSCPACNMIEWVSLALFLPEAVHGSDRRPDLTMTFFIKCQLYVVVVVFGCV